MESLILHPNNEEELVLYEQMAKVLKTPIERIKDRAPYNPEFVEKIKRGEEDRKAGKGRKVTIEELDGLWK